MSDNTTTTSTARCIDRRTLLSGLGGGLVALAGCSDSTGSSNSTDRSPAPSPSSETDVLESVTFEGKSGYGARIIAKIELAEDSKITQIGLINGKGNEVHRALISERETVAEFVVARPGDDPSERITQGENTLVLVGENKEVEIPLTYSASLELYEVVGPGDSSELPEDSRWRRQHIGLIVENTGLHPDILQTFVSENGPHVEAFDKQRIQRDIGVLAKPDKEMLIPVENYLAEIFRCSESYTRDASLRLKPAFSTPLVFTQTLKYSPQGEEYCDVALEGEPSITTQTATSSE